MVLMVYTSWNTAPSVLLMAKQDGFVSKGKPPLMSMEKLFVLRVLHRILPNANTGNRDLRKVKKDFGRLRKHFLN